MTLRDAPAAEVARAFPETWVVVLTAPEARGLSDREIAAAMRVAGCEEAQIGRAHV